MFFSKKRNWIIIGFISLLAGILACSSPFSKKQSISYNEHIKPILNKHCLVCHGGIKKSGGFSLLFEAEAFQKTESGKIAIIPGNANGSELIKRIIHHDPEMRMPLDAPPLSEQEISLLKKWIDDGAKWEKHWAYVSPVSIQPPAIESDWVKNGIDYFILEKLRSNNLNPAPEADRNTLIRRLSLDLIGLPPSPEEVATFVNDQSPDAYEKLIDRILDSPHFGERWAAMWLDLARYADTKGYEKDPYRNIWRYRDWVINAFNQDMPFDQFTIEQLAGDMLPNASREQLMATAFHRNTMTNTEGGTEDEEYRVAAVIDRLNTTMEVWQGTTIACVQCHSHPYDPFRHEEFYELFAFFNNTMDADLDNEHPNLEFYEETALENINEIIGFIQKLEPQKNIDTDAAVSTQIEQAIFPRLHPNYCDDFQNVQFHGNYWLSNWSYRVQAGEKDQFYFKFDDIDISALDSISYTWSSTGNDAVIECRLDSINGSLINRFNCTATKPSGLKHLWESKFETKTNPISIEDKLTLSDKHDLVFEIINTKASIPDGIILLSEIELHYNNKPKASETLKKHKQDLLDARQQVEYSPVMKEKTPAFARKTRVFERGNFLTKGKAVSAKIPESLPPLTKGEDHNRLAFAKWLVQKDNPLTARVIVNRFWEQIFGTGLVETLEDFGSQGAKPSHPALLDYLALRFMNEHQWSVKQLLKEICLSASYRQSSVVTAEKLELDPYNLLLSRGARFRLSAEQIRDQALAVSGLLNDTIGGKSVMPLQPDNIWQTVYNGDSWITPENDSRYRRGIYTFWKRTAPYPSMMSFDSPSREVCISRRIRTNTPLQALVTMNDPVYLEAAEALGEKMKTAGDGDIEKSIKTGYQTALAKEASPEVLLVLKTLYLTAEAESNPVKVVGISKKMDGSEKFIDPMTVVANAILNLDAFMMKE